MLSLQLTDQTTSIIVSIVAASAVVITALLTWRSSVRKSALEELRTLIDALTARVDQEMTRRLELEGKVNRQEAEIICLRSSHETDSLYISVLIEHINAGKPPPPPARPQPRHRAE